MGAHLIARVRLVSGLVLLVYVVGHLVNHAFGLISLEAMEAGLRFSIDPWRTLPGTFLLGGAALAHTVTALVALYQRRTLRMPVWQAAQNVLGLLIPFVLVAHILGTRMLVEVWEVDHSYTLEMAFLWVMVPSAGILQAIAVVVVWLHACIGVHYWLRTNVRYVALQPLAFCAALLLPTLSLAGYVSAGNRVLERVASDPAWPERVAEAASVRPEMVGWVFSNTIWARGGAAGVILALLAMRALRGRSKRKEHTPRLFYGADRVFQVGEGMTMLEVLRAASVPHPSVCGGRARCSTCRVQIGQGASALPPPEPEEQRLLDRIGADENVRLACQVRPSADVQAIPLLPPASATRKGNQRAAYRRSEERQVAILFADLRGFTSFSEDRLPYDVVFVLNRYRISMAEAIEEAGGVVNEFVGDGIMALFGLESGVDDGARRALRAAEGMRERLRRLNESIASELPEPLRIGIGIHTGPVIVGEMGYDQLKGITVVGDTVNTASRLEQLTKQFDAMLVVSDEAARLGELETVGAVTEDVEIRGREGRLTVHALR